MSKQKNSKITKIEAKIENIFYKALLIKSLVEYDLSVFDINTAKPSGLLISPNSPIAYSKWVSPKRTRTYPFERIYHTINAGKKITIIPVIKDEGADGDLDKIQFSTFSWMSLLGIYVVLGYYDSASKNLSPLQKNRQKLTAQKLNVAHVNEQIRQILKHKLEAIHWNRTVIQSKLLPTLDIAMDSYEKISKRTKVRTHSHNDLKRFREELIKDIEQYKNISLSGSHRASRRELATTHALEYLGVGEKCCIVVKNYLGGEYPLTVDEILKEGNKYVLQESKNTSKKTFLPSLSDIRDGLFKLILYSNIDKLLVNGKRVSFTTRLKLTSTSIREKISLPTSDIKLDEYFARNSRILNRTTMGTISLLNKEVKENGNISVEIARNK